MYCCACASSRVHFEARSIFRFAEVAEIETGVDGFRTSPTVVIRRAFYLTFPAPVPCRNFIHAGIRFSEAIASPTPRHPAMQYAATLCSAPSFLPLGDVQAKKLGNNLMDLVFLTASSSRGSPSARFLFYSLLSSFTSFLLSV